MSAQATRSLAFRFGYCVRVLAVIVDPFPTQVRFAGFAIGYNVSTSLFGGTAPAFNSWLIGVTGDPLVPAYTCMVACAIGAVAPIFLVETAGASLRGREIPVSARRIGIRASAR